LAHPFQPARFSGGRKTKLDAPPLFNLDCFSPLRRNVVPFNATSINLTRSEQRDISIGEACGVSIGGASGIGTRVTTMGEPVENLCNPTTDTLEGLAITAVLDGAGHITISI
jgi:hypothetical protein